MKNPKDFSPTPANYFKVNDKSHPAKEMKHNDTRPWGGATSATHFKATKKSGHDNIGNMYATAGDRTEQMTSPSHFKKNEKSKPGVPVAPVKWHKRGYDLTLPTTLSK